MSNKIPNTEAMMTVEDVSDYVRVSTQSVYREIQRGKLRACRIGRQLRISRDDLNEYLERQREQPI